ncbi:MAG: glycosyltransferase family 39 protein, partial [Ktedonobacteraceae bacterium]
AYLVVPAFGLLYLLAAPRRLWTRLGQLSLAALLLLVISLSWATAVDLIPASQRPYVGSSPNNSEISLAFGYNGIDRVLGRLNFRKAQQGTTDEAHHLSATGTAKLAGNGHTSTPETSISTDLNSTDQRALRNFSMFGSGTPGPLRLLQDPLGGQIAWLLPLALLGILALAWQRRPRFQEDRQQQSLLLWGTWVLTMASFFSISGFFHQYYMTTFAPAICALFGIGLVLMWQDYRNAGWRGWLLPLALVVTAWEQVNIISNNPAWGTELIPLIAIPCTLVALALIVVRLLPFMRVNTRVLLPVLGCGVAALLLTPAIWSAIPALQNSSVSTPSAGPTHEYAFLGSDVNSKIGNIALTQYLMANQGNAKFLVATPSSMSADALILATNQPVMAMGGFSGRDPILTTNQLSTLVANGTVRFFLLNNPTFLARNFSGAARNGALSWFGFGRNGQNTLTSWVAQHCTTVPASKWQSSASSATSSNAMVLYDCAGTQ